MKKILLFIVLLLFLAGCNKGETKVTNTSIELEGFPSSGYEWICTSDNNEIFDMTSTFVSNDTEMDGAGGTYTFTLVGKKQGKAVLTCVYKRFDNNSTINQTKTYNINVDKNLNVTY